MHIRAFVGGIGLALAMLAFAPLAMAVDEPPDICVLDFAQPAVDLVAPAAPDCTAIDLADVRFALDSTSGDEGEAAWPSYATAQRNALDFATYRQHVDPDRCLV